MVPSTFNGKVTVPIMAIMACTFIHTYAVVNGQKTCISATGINVPKPEIKTTITKESEVSVKVTVSNVLFILLVSQFLFGLKQMVRTISNGIRLLSNLTAHMF